MNKNKAGIQKMIVDELSKVFSISDVSFYQVQQELKNTHFFKLVWLSNSSDSVLDTNTNQALSNFNDYQQVEFNTELASNKVESTEQAKIILFGALTWQVLFDFVKTCEAQSINLSQCKLVKPTDDLNGAIYFSLADVISDDIKALLNSWAERQQVELCCLHNAPTMSKPGLLVMDMDSTAIEIECIDEIAKLAGVGEQVSQVTAAAMRGELDFAESLHARVATLTDAPVSIIDQVADNLPLMPGLENLVAQLQLCGWTLVIASGGFTYMTDVLKRQLNLDETVANQLEMKDGKLTGKVLGRIVDANVKAETVVALAKKYNVDMNQTIAMGDGANDLVMMAAAQLGVAFHAKPLVRAQADVCVKSGGLDQLLYLL